MVRFAQDKRVVIGYVPIRRDMFPAGPAIELEKEVRARFETMAESCGDVALVPIDEAVDGGMLWDVRDVDGIVEYFRKKKVDAVALIHCNFGQEEAAAKLAKELDKPVLLWGPRDPSPESDTSGKTGPRDYDTQCGMFACTKVLRRFGVAYSYIWNCETESEDFRQGFENFIRVAAVVKTVKNLRVAKFGARPQPFMSVMANEGDLASRLGVTVIPISPNAAAARADQLQKEASEAYQACREDLRARFDASGTPEETVDRIAALKLAVKRLMEENRCTAGAMECWSAASIFGAPVCAVLGELADLGLPLACETDVNGAVTMAMLQAAALGEEAVFLADLTIRHPQNDNAELLWHCGPFPYSLKDPASAASLAEGQERFVLKKGPITLCRFDEAGGEYYLFGGEGRAVDGPKTTGTYVWFEADNWKRWEEKLMFGPYIHHIGGVYGNYKPVLREAARYLGLIFDDADQQGIYSL